MRTKRFFISIFSIFWLFGLAQETSEQNVEVYTTASNEPRVDTATTKGAKYQPNFMVGIDVLHLGFSFFSDQKLYQGFVSTRIKKRIYGIVDLGMESNLYDKNGYDFHADGFFGKLGVLYMATPDPENFENGFYVGGKLGASFYNQEIKSIPIRWIEGRDSYASFPKASQSAYWVEAAIGGRIELLGTNVFLDVQVQPRYLIYSTKQENIRPMVVPGFGKGAGKFNLGFAWSVAYKF